MLLKITNCIFKENEKCVDKYIFQTFLLFVDRSALKVELDCVMQTAARDHIRDWCIQLDQHARSRQEALKNLRNQWQSILDFRQLVVSEPILDLLNWATTDIENSLQINMSLSFKLLTLYCVATGP